MKTHYDIDTINNVRNTDMLDFFSNRYRFTFKKQGSSYRCKEHNSLVVKDDNKRWYWNSKCTGGAGVLDFLMKVENMSFFDAMATMVNSPTTFKSLPTNKPVISKPRENVILPEKGPFPYKTAFDYLCNKRKLDKGIILDLIEENIIYEDTRGNVVFVRYDKNEVARFACVRSTSESLFRMDCKGSDKRYSFYLKGFDKEVLYVFESPIDALSHATLTNIDSNDNNAWRNNCRLALGGTSTVALDAYITQNLFLKKIILCLDNDIAGINAIKDIKQKYLTMGKAIVVCLPKDKDFNQDLVNLAESNNSLASII